MPQLFADTYYGEEEITAWFNNQPKCRYQEKIISNTDIENAQCSSLLTIQGEFIHLKQGGFLYEGECDGGGDMSIGHTKNELNIGNTIYGIANSETYKIIYGGKNYFDIYPEIPLCKGGDTTQSSQNIVVGVGILSIILLGIVFFWIKKSLQKSKHKK